MSGESGSAGDAAALVPGAIVGRRRELAALRAWLEAARSGSGRLVLCAGEPGIGKTRLAQELAGSALAGGAAVGWGRCVEAGGAPASWPWRLVLRSLEIDADAVLRGDVESPEDRFRLFDDVTEAVPRAAPTTGLVVILDDLHGADEPSLLLLRHVADRLGTSRLLVLACFRDVEPGSGLPRVPPDLLRAPAVDRLDLHGLGLVEVREQFAAAGVVEATINARAVLDVTGGNPLFVREIARAMADGTWRPDRPPKTVLDIVTARLDRARWHASTSASPSPEKPARHYRRLVGERFRARATVDTKGRVSIVLPFDPDEAWGAKTAHHVNGTVAGRRVRSSIQRTESGWTLVMGPAWRRDCGIDIADAVVDVELAAEGPQRAELDPDIAAALDAAPDAAAFFDSLATFYRKAYLRWIGATTRRPDVRAGRIAEMVELLRARQKQRPG